jgi:Protein of unknown function (DUF3014)
MEQWSARDDRPYIRETHATHAAYVWWLFFLVIAAGVAAAGYYFWPQHELLGPAPIASAPPQTEAPAQAQAEQPQAAASAPSEPAKPLPTLENSDAMMRETVTELVGPKAFEAMVYPKELVRRIVATVDNLPRETAPRRVMPLEPVPGIFGVSTSGDETTLAPANSARYSPYVRVLTTLDARALARGYSHSYPLFQRAYAELGFPDRRFHDRLLEAIDDLLEAPEPAGPVKLVRPKVFYQFADPELESLSAGQKIMLRMGAANATIVKTKLREIRRELAALAIR